MPQRSHQSAGFGVIASFPQGHYIGDAGRLSTPLKDSMLSYVSGNLFEAPVQTLVNTVNTVGVMGKGIALTFRQIYPEMFREYRELCERGQLKIGSLYLYRTESRFVLNFPTKEHWRNPSRLSYIEAGLRAFVAMYEHAGIHSIAFPPLGCGNGELDFALVRPLMERYLAPLPIRVLLYAPLPKNAAPEHRSVEEMKRWLRESAPDLAFSEVWSDLSEILRDRVSLQTLARGASFEAQMVENGAAVRIWASGKVSRVDQEEFADLWRELRDIGFITPHSLAANRESIGPYIFGILNALKFVQPLSYGTDFDGFQHTPMRGLQLRPSASEDCGQAQLQLV